MSEFYTPQEIADILSISYEQALSFIKYSGIVYVRIGRLYRVNKDVLHKFLSGKKPIIVDVNEN